MDPPPPRLEDGRSGTSTNLRAALAFKVEANTLRSATILSRVRVLQCFRHRGGTPVSPVGASEHERILQEGDAKFADGDFSPMRETSLLARKEKRQLLGHKARMIFEVCSGDLNGGRECDTREFWESRAFAYPSARRGRNKAQHPHTATVVRATTLILKFACLPPSTHMAMCAS